MAGLCMAHEATKQFVLDGDWTQQPTHIVFYADNSVKAKLLGCRCSHAESSHFGIIHFGLFSQCPLGFEDLVAHVVSGNSIAGLSSPISLCEGAICIHGDEFRIVLIFCYELVVVISPFFFG